MVINVEDFQKQFFEYMVFRHCQVREEPLPSSWLNLVRQLSGIATIYVVSSEYKNLLRIDKIGVSKFIMVKLPDSEIKKLGGIAGISLGKGGLLRELKPDNNWLTVSEEYILSKPSILTHAPIPCKMVGVSIIF